MCSQKLQQCCSDVGKNWISALTGCATFWTGLRVTHALGGSTWCLGTTLVTPGPGDPEIVTRAQCLPHWRYNIEPLKGMWRVRGGRTWEKAKWAGLTGVVVDIVGANHGVVRLLPAHWQLISNAVSKSQRFGLSAGRQEAASATGLNNHDSLGKLAPN